MARCSTVILVCAIFSLSAFSQQQEKETAGSSTPAGVRTTTVALNDAKKDPGKDEQAKSVSETKEGAQEQPQVAETFLSAVSALRGSLGKRGLDVNVGYKADDLSVAAGGLGRGSAYIQNIDVILSVEGGKALGLEGTSFGVHILSNNGGGLNRYVGDAQMVSNIEGVPLLKLYQLWGQYDLPDKAVSVRAGLYDLNSEFYVTTASALFLNGSHGIGKEFSQTGCNGPSVFPNTGLALRVMVRPWENVFTQLAVLDARPGTEEDPYATSFRLDSRNGALIVGEFGYSLDANDKGPGFTKVAVGVWKYTAAFDELLPDETGEPVVGGGNSGAYLVAEKQIVTGGASSSRSVAFFVRGGFADSRINKFDYHYGFGVTYTGLFPGRDEDVFGVAVAHAHGGSAFKSLMQLQGTLTRSGETAIEIMYRAVITPWLAVQPDIQFVSQPGAESGIQDATVMGARMEISL